MIFTFALFSEGVQLLCLIDKGQDACRYLQTYGEWYHSVWLAKSTLNEKDSSEILSRWAEDLISIGVNQKVCLLFVISRSFNMAHLFDLGICCVSFTVAWAVSQSY